MARKNEIQAEPISANDTPPKSSAIKLLTSSLGPVKNLDNKEVFLSASRRMV